MDPREVLLDVLRWRDTFVRSPGLGGTAALGADWVGFRQWRRQGQAQVQARRDEQWWEVYRLAHAARPAVPGVPAPQDKRLLQTLAGAAETEVQAAAVQALVAAYTREAGQAGRSGQADDEKGSPR